MRITKIESTSFEYIIRKRYENLIPLFRCYISKHSLKSHSDFYFNFNFKKIYLLRIYDVGKNEN